VANYFIVSILVVSIVLSFMVTLPIGFATAVSEVFTYMDAMNTLARQTIVANEIYYLSSLLYYWQQATSVEGYSDMQVSNFAGISGKLMEMEQAVRDMASGDSETVRQAVAKFNKIMGFILSLGTLLKGSDIRRGLDVYLPSWGGVFVTPYIYTSHTYFYGRASRVEASGVVNYAVSFLPICPIPIDISLEEH